MKSQREQLEKMVQRQENFPYGLTKREMEILEHLSGGLRYKSIDRQIIFIGGNDPQLLLDSLLEAQRQQPRRSNKKGPKGKYCVDGTQDIIIFPYSGRGNDYYFLGHSLF